MPNQHKTPLLAWHPQPGLLERLRALIERRGVTRTAALNEALSEYLDRNENSEDPQ